MRKGRECSPQGRITTQSVTIRQSNPFGGVYTVTQEPVNPQESVSMFHRSLYLHTVKQTSSTHPCLSVLRQVKIYKPTHVIMKNMSVKIMGREAYSAKEEPGWFLSTSLHINMWWWDLEVYSHPGEKKTNELTLQVSYEYPYFCQENTKKCNPLSEKIQIEEVWETFTR